MVDGARYRLGGRAGEQRPTEQTRVVPRRVGSRMPRELVLARDVGVGVGIVVEDVNVDSDDVVGGGWSGKFQGIDPGNADFHQISVDAIVDQRGGDIGSVRARRAGADSDGAVVSYVVLSVEGSVGCPGIIVAADVNLDAVLLPECAPVVPSDVVGHVYQEVEICVVPSTLPGTGKIVGIVRGRPVGILLDVIGNRIARCS